MPDDALPNPPESPPLIEAGPSDRLDGVAGEPADVDGPARRLSGRAKWLIGVGVFAVAVFLAGFAIRLPYDTLSPGGTLDVQPRISIQGARTYPNKGPLMLLFVRERTQVNVWRWVQAWLDPNIDLVKPQDLTGGNSQQEQNLQDVCDMSQSQVSAKVAALTALGYHVPTEPGLVVAGLPPDLPAVKVVRPCDQIVAADGRLLKQPADLSKIVRAHAVGTAVALRLVRAGHTLTLRVPVVSFQGVHVIGVSLALRYDVPLRISVNTSDITGPSGGLAMALAIIDDLTPGDLTGGKRVAVTGTIAADGTVGPIGGLAQKAVSAKAAHAQIFIVPGCDKNAPPEQCETDVPVARKRVGKHVELAPVTTLAQALKVLRDAGGAPVHVASPG